MEPKEKKAFEPTGLVPRSIVRTFERFRQQLLPGSEKAAIREYRISRYQVLVSARCLFTLLTIPIVTNWFVSSWLLSPVIEHFWNTRQNEIFLNSYQEERAFAELEFFSDKLFFESLLSNEQHKGYANDVVIGYVTDNNLISTDLYALSDFRSKPPTVSESYELLENIFLEKSSFHHFSGIIDNNPAIFVNHVDQLNLSKSPLHLQHWDFKEDPTCVISTYEITPYFCFPSQQDNLSLISVNDLVDLKSFSPSQINPPKQLLNSWNIKKTKDSLRVKEKIQEKILELAVYYNQQIILSITNVAGDMVSIFTLGCLFMWMKPEISILKSFLIEAIYSLSDTTKSFFLILLTDLLVGFHSPRGWETALEILLKHFGLPENQDFVFLFVATFPVLLDTVFKYWIFRHLNKISPSTVATYHSMIE